MGSKKHDNAKWKARDKEQKRLSEKQQREREGLLPTTQPHMERENTHADKKHKQTGPPDPPKSTKYLHTNGKRKKKKRERPTEATEACRHTRNM